MEEDDLYKKFAEKFYLDAFSPTTLKEIENAESTLNYTFPLQYKNFMLSIGSQPVAFDSEKMEELNFNEKNFDCLFDEFSTLDEVVSDEKFLGSGFDSDSGIIPIGRNGMGDYLCFKKKTNDFKVYLAFHETGEVTPIADSFVQFIKIISQFPAYAREVPRLKEYMNIFIDELGPNKLAVLKDIGKFKNWSAQQLISEQKNLPILLIQGPKESVEIYGNHFKMLGATVRCEIWSVTI